MIFNNLKNSFVSAAAFLVLGGTAVAVSAAPVKNIVLVHGAERRQPLQKLLSADQTNI
jgi:hypothetical protein